MTFQIDTHVHSLLPDGGEVQAFLQRDWSSAQEASFRLLEAAYAARLLLDESGMMASYCDIAPGHPYHGPYHAKEYGFPIRDDSKLFERLALEINQAGLSWLTILKKRDAFDAAFDGFDIDRVAAFGRRERSRLLRDPGIIRNQLKIDAVIENARRIITIRESHNSFARWLDAHHPLSKDEWVKLFKKTFLFTGGEITGEFLISTGYLPGAHVPTCPIYERVARKRPAWMR